ncbi:venom allergen 3-like [Euwallacea similis]|uniref:venom allergen 3-like n=1 Tax=Euwallacea similis TaxID=1736056 RepID=UPI00344B7AAD
MEFHRVEKRAKQRHSQGAWPLFYCDVGLPNQFARALRCRRDARYADFTSDAGDNVRTMELPRIASQSSIYPPFYMLTHPNGPPRTPVSKRLLSSSIQNSEPQIPVIPTAPQYQPSRRREEAKVLQNLRRRLNAAKIVQANKPEPVEARTCANNNLSPEETDSRPYLLQKILHNRPVSMILDISEIRTAWQDSDFITDCLCWHNVYRQRHNSPPLTMSPELCDLAQTWANHLAHTNRFYYRNDKDIGQNLFCRVANGLVSDVTGQEVTTYWYSAVKQYDFRNEPEMRANVNAGHFTQLVWANSKHFGLGKARSRSGKIVVVAHYAPVGNISGAYLQNVLPPCEELPRVPQPLHKGKIIISGSTSDTESQSTTSSI